jgi:hypothetical protein
MSPIDQRITLAEYHGFTLDDYKDKKKSIIGWKKEGVYYPVLLNYLQDLNAMRELEMSLSDMPPAPDKKSDRTRYREELCVVCACHGGPIHATAVQKAEAFLKTIGKWVD